MIYSSVKKGTFLERPNRFIARVLIDGAEETVHVKNTGRCRELLMPGATVYAEDFTERLGARKTAWDLIAVEKETESGTMMVNMDSQAPNKVVAEALRSGAIRLPDFPETITLVKGESTFGDSRFDFYVEGTEREPEKTETEAEADRPEPAEETGAGEAAETSSAEKAKAASSAEPSKNDVRRAYIEVKGVTLEEAGAARFPDAPTERGVKHINELVKVKECGMEAYIIFVIQMKPITYMEPNDRTHKAFGDALREARKRGVHVLAYDCEVEPGALSIGKEIPVRL